MVSLGNRIYLRESKINSFYEVFQWLYENFIFFRWIYFKNRPRSNFLLARSFLMVGVLFSFYYGLISNIKLLILGIDVDPVILFVTMSVVSYWYMAFSFQGKTNYLSTEYNRILTEWGAGNSYTAKLLAVNLSTQVLSLDLWGHRIYGPLFVRTLEEAIEFRYRENKESQLSKADLVKRIQAGELRVNEARSLLWDYQNHLLKDGIEGDYKLQVA